MDPRPRNWLFFITGLLHWQSATTQTSYIIDTVVLRLLPSDTVESGTNVTLLCEVIISRDSPSELTYHLKFTKNDEEISSLDMQEDMARYELSPARAADSGSYGCHVTFKKKSKSSPERTLTVTGLQKPVIYLNKTVVFESEEVVARCSAPSEKGSFIFYFYQRFGSMDRSEKFKTVRSNGNSVDTRLVFNQVGDRHVYCDYEIPLVGRSNHSDQLQVLVKGMHINPTMNILPAAEVYEGDNITVVCKVVGIKADMGVAVFLIKDKTIMQKATVSLSYTFNVTVEDSGELMCKAEWKSLQKETYHKLTVKELISKPRLTVEPLDLFEGDNLKVTCYVSVYVPDRIQNNSIKYLIYKDHREVHRGRVYNTIVRSSNNGNYTCKVRASSSGSSFEKESLAVIVKAKIPVSKPTMRVVGGRLVLGKPFQLICESEKGSFPISYTLNAPKEYQNVKIITKQGEAAVFTATITKRSQLKDFLCQVRNNPQNPPEIAMGQQLLVSTTIIEPVSKPFLISVPDVRDITERHDVTLICSVLHGSVPITFTWYSADTGVPLASQNPVTLKGSYVISDVGTRDNGGYYCESTNAANVTKTSEVLTVTVRMAGWKKALIGVVCLLLLVALVLLIIFKKHMIRFKRKRVPELSVKSAGTKIERLSLTQSEVTQMANATPSMMGKSVWSEHVSGSESDNDNTVAAPKSAELEYAEVQIKQADPSQAPVKKDTETAYSEIRHSTQGVPEAVDSQASVEYAELNHEAEAQSGDGNHDDHTVQEEHKEEPCEDNCDTNNDTGGPGE